MGFCCSASFKRFFNKNVLAAAIISSVDTNVTSQELESFKAKYGLAVESKWERVFNIFKRDISGNLHPHLMYAMSATQYGLLTGAFIGGLLGYSKNKDNFKSKNDCTAFLNRKEAQRSLVRYSTDGFIKGIVKVSPLFGGYFGCFVLSSLCFEAYRNKSGIMEYSFAGIATSALFRIHYGLKGIISGGVVGGILGTCYGAAYWAICKAFGLDRITIEYIKYGKEK